MACINPAPDLFHNGAALALSDLQVFRRSFDTALGDVGFDLVKLGDHVERLAVLVLGIVGWHGFEDLAPCVPPAAAAFATCLFVAEAIVCTVAVNR